MSAPRDLVYIGLGANLQQPEYQLRAAVRCLAEEPQFSEVAVSAFYQTPPWGNTEQPPFINAVVSARCSEAPRSALEALLRIERDLGRLRDEMRWSPRIIDLDLLFFGHRSFQASGLSIPHPHADERAFVLIPLIEIAEQRSDPRVASWKVMLSKLPVVDVVRLATHNRPTASA